MLTISFSCCEDRPIQIDDNCPDCRSHVEINLQNWPSKPDYAYFSKKNKSDTVINIDISETGVILDQFNDTFLLWSVPFKQDTYYLDAVMFNDWGTFASLRVFEVEFGTAVDTYLPIFNGSSFISVDSIDVDSSYFSVSFDLTLYPDGDIYGETHNSTYPPEVHIIGHTSGTAMFE